MATKTVGVLGGMGAKATAHFYTMLTNAQTVAAEQAYMDAIIYSKTSIPDRTAFILGESSQNPAPSLVAAAVALQQAGADFIVIPCVTAHYFYDEIAAAVNIPVINALDVLAAGLAAQQVKTVGILATDGTLQARILHDVLEPLGVQIVTPNPAQQGDLMAYIYDVKQGKCVADKNFATLETSLAEKGAQAIVLGCTELSLMNSEAWRLPYIDVLQVLVDAALEMGGEDNQ
ncbi:MAG: amino acid racemase [Defluviitaleaceae bacterium]|nr:amino acid racemase [Defluviitaleaceae bacterium]